MDGHLDHLLAPSSLRRAFEDDIVTAWELSKAMAKQREQPVCFLGSQAFRWLLRYRLF